MLRITIVCVICYICIPCADSADYSIPAHLNVKNELNAAHLKNSLCMLKAQAKSTKHSIPHKHTTLIKKGTFLAKELCLYQPELSFDKNIIKNQGSSSKLFVKVSTPPPSVRI